MKRAKQSKLFLGNSWILSPVAKCLALRDSIPSINTKTTPRSLNWFRLHTQLVKGKTLLPIGYLPHG